MQEKTLHQTWQLSCLGGLRAERGAVRIERFRTQKTAALLALLALRGAQNRETVCALLWPDNAPEAARNSLSAALSALRRDLGDETLVTDRQSVALAPGAVETDVAAFDSTLKTGNYARAVELYRGHLLPGFHEDPFPILAGEAEEKARGAFTSRLEELEIARDADALRSLARRAFALFGDDERWFLALIRAHQFAGDYDAALRAYESLGRFARKNGDVTSDEARALAKAIRREKEAAGLPPSSNLASVAEVERLEEGGSPANDTRAICDQPELLTPPSSTLPQVWTRFFGREAERELLLQWLHSGQKLITLSGAGGSGKTRLALETLRQIAPDWDGATVFVPLAALSDPELLVAGVRDALQLSAAPESSPLEQIERALRGKRAVLLLDNFEQLVVDGAEKLQLLRERLPDAAFLVTSRVLLQLPGEREFPVAPLPTPLQNSAPERVKDCASVALFCDRSGLNVDAQNAEAVGALCRRLDGIPLALELAAARAKVMSPAQILERLQKHPDFLQSRELGVPARHKTLRATIEWSTELLSPQLRQFWTRLSLFHGGWTLEAAEKIAAPDVCEEWETLDFLTQLRECSLVFVEERGDECRFRMLQTLREFGREQLKTAQRDEIERTRFGFYLDLAQEAAGAMQGPAQTLWLRRLDAEQDNLRASLSWARDHDAPRGLQLATALIDFWETRLSLDEGRGWIEEFLRATGPQKQELETRSRALSGAGRLAWFAADFAGAGALIEQGLEVARETGDAASLIYSTHSAARLAAIEGQNARAQQLGREGVRLAREAGDAQLLLGALVDLGPSLLIAGDFEALRQTCAEAVALARGETNQGALVVALNMEAIADFYQGRFASALALLEESEALCRRLESRWDLMVCLGARGSVWCEQNELSRAQQAFNQTFSICLEADLQDHSVANLLLAGSYLMARRAEFRDAAQLMGAVEAFLERLGALLMPFMAPDYERYHALVRDNLGDSRFLECWQKGRAMTVQNALQWAIRPVEADADLATRARALNGAGRLAWYASDMTGASALLEQGLAAARQSGDRSALIYATRTLSRVAAVGGEAQKGRELGRESVRLARETGDESLLLESLMDLAFADFNVGDFEAVETGSREALALARRLGDEGAQALSLNLLACMWEHQARLDEALPFIEESEAICRRLGLGWELAVALALQGQIWSKRGDFGRSQSFYNEALTLCRDTSLSTWYVVTTFLSMSWAWLRRGEARGAAIVMGAAQSLSESIGYTLMPALVPTCQEGELAAKRALGEAEFALAFARGRQMTPEQAADFALHPASIEVTPTDAAQIAARARALSGAGRLAWHDSDFAASRALVEQGLEAAQQSGDAASFVPAVAAFVRLMSVSGDVEDDLSRGRALAETAVARARNQNDEALLMEALIALAYAAVMRLDDNRQARAIHEEAVAIARKLGDDLQLATALVSLAVVHYLDTDFERANELLDEAHALARRLDSAFLGFAALWARCHVARETGDFAASHAAAVEALELCRDNAGFKWSVSNILLAAAFLRVKCGDVARGVELASAAQSNSEGFGYRMVPMLRFDFNRAMEAARRALSAADFERAWERGRRLSAEDAIAAAKRAPEAISLDAPLLAARSRALSGAGRLAWHGSDLENSRELVHQGLDAARQAGDLKSFVVAVAAFVRFAMVTGDVEGYMTESRVLSEEAVARSKAPGDRALMLESLISLGYAHTIVGHLDAARDVNTRAIALARDLGDENSLARVLTLQAAVCYHGGDFSTARQLVEESLPICERLGSTWDSIAAQWTLCHIAREQGDLGTARRAGREVLELHRANPTLRWAIANVLLMIGYLDLWQDEPHRAATLMGAAQAIWDTTGYHIVPVQRAEDLRYHAKCRAKLGEREFEAAWEKGRALTVEAAMELALASLN